LIHFVARNQDTRPIWDQVALSAVVCFHRQAAFQKDRVGRGRRPAEETRKKRCQVPFLTPGWRRDQSGHRHAARPLSQLAGQTRTDEAVSRPTKSRSISAPGPQHSRKVINCESTSVVHSSRSTTAIPIWPQASLAGRPPSPLNRSITNRLLSLA
jgi:hypothetical protein